LHLDEVIAAADGPELRQRLVACAADAIRVERRVVDGDVLALAKIGVCPTISRRSGATGGYNADLTVGIAA
jgi:hypothetical protein